MMKNFKWRVLLPHIIAVAIFLIVAVIYCKPILEGKVLQQHDSIQWKGMAQDCFKYKDKHGSFPLWTNGMFSGMPSFQIAASYNNNLPYYAISLLSLYLPSPIHFFFLACICFYFLAQVLRVNQVVSIMGALAYAYAVYNPGVIVAGHETKMLTIDFMPALLGSLLLIYKRYYWLGAALTALSASILVAANHMQITYYTLIMAAAATLSFIIKCIQEKNYKHLIIAGMTAGLAGIVGVLVNASILFSTFDFSNATIRGGSELNSRLTDNTNKGLSKDYALSYSMYKSEPLTMMFPKLYGGSANPAEFNQENSKAMEALSAMPQDMQNQLQYSYQAYWGGIGPIPTSAPPYIGAIICFLAIIGMFLLDNEHKWWIAGVTVLTVMMSWGLYFESFNTWLLYHLPMYNKFRVPSMILVVPQLVLIVLACLSLDKILSYPAMKDKAVFQKLFRNGLIAVGVFFVIALMLYFGGDFYSLQDQNILKQVKEISQPQVKEMVLSFFAGLKADRQSLMIGTIVRSFILCTIAAVLIYIFFKGKLKTLPLTVLFTVLAFGDLMAIDVKYLNSDLYEDKEEQQSNYFTPTAADNAILQDTSFYRVFNTTKDPFNDGLTSYFHHCIGGYNPAKLSIYQDLIERQLSKSPMNMPVLNMLNTKYFIVGNAQGVPQAQQNPGALGNAWFVKDVRWVNGAEEAMKAMDNFNPRDTAIADKQFQSVIHYDTVSSDSSAFIKLINNDNDYIQYRSSNSKNGFGIFSEVYYKNGWKAYIDKKESPIARVNYVLRGLSIPAGNHEIEFRFEPQSYKTGSRITNIFQILLVIILVGGIFMDIRHRQKISLQ